MVQLNSMMNQEKRILPALIGILILCLSFSFPGKRVITGSLYPLFNGKNLNGWDTFIGPEQDETGKKINKPIEGLNKDSLHVFSVTQDQGEKVIRISGEKWGGLISKKEFRNFHLHLEFKWGKLTWGTKRNHKKDSGLLYYSVGEQGADFGYWMRSQEFQIEEGNCGEYWGVAGGSEGIKAIQKDSSLIYDPNGSPMLFNEKSNVGRHCRKGLDFEKPTGEWNSLDLYCLNGTSVHLVNGKVVMVLRNSSQISGDTLLPMEKGKIQLQSEGSEIFYKNIGVEDIGFIPKEFLD